MRGPIIREGAVVISDGTIISVGPAVELRRDHPNAQIIELGACIILPGLINAHTHLEHSLAECGTSPGGDFGDWILNMRGRQGSASTEQATRVGIAQCLRFGVTCIGDISQKMSVTRPILAASPLRGVSFGEVLGLGKLRHRFDALFPQAIDRAQETPRLRIGLTPHAPYTVDRAGYEMCLQVAQQRRLPLATHLAETCEETEFLATHGGMFRRVWDTIGQWADCTTHPGPPVQMARDLGLLDYSTLLAHVNHVSDAELDLLASGRASVVFCPRTHAYFQRPAHRWREMLDRGINVAVGTDSCASSPDLNVVDDLRLLHRQSPQTPARQLWELVTTRAAAALQAQNQVGAIAPGLRADLCIFPVSSDDPLVEILESDAMPKQVWIDGARV